MSRQSRGLTFVIYEHVLKRKEKSPILQEKS